MNHSLYLQLHANITTFQCNLHYVKRYIKFILRFKLDNHVKGLTESHHILPSSKSLFPQFNDLKVFAWNRAILSVRAHFIAHMILAKVFTHDKSQSAAAYLMSTSRHGIRIKSSKTYESLRSAMSSFISTTNTGRTPPNKGVPCTDETRAKIGNANRGKRHTRTPDAIIKTSEFHTGRTRSDVTKLRIKQKALARPKITCPYCGLIGQPSNMKRHHFDNCKLHKFSPNT